MKTKDRIFMEIQRIIFEEQRLFSFKDFAYPKKCPQEGKYAHGTVRNIFALLKKEGLIKLVYRSPQAFYTLTDVDFEKGTTPNYRGVYLNQVQKKLFKIFKVTSMDKPAIHDIRLLFLCKIFKEYLAK